MTGAILSWLQVSFNEFWTVNVSHQRIIEALEAQFATRQLLFWDDPDGEFSAWVDGLSLEGVHVLRLDRTPALQVKLDVEAVRSR